MDLRFMAIIMAIAIIMDILGRMARKRAAEEQPQESPDEGWDVLQALTEAEELPDKLLREALPPAVQEPVPPTRPMASERAVPDPVALDPVAIAPTDRPVAARAEPRPWEQPVRDRTARPIEVRSRAPRSFDPVSRTATSGPGIDRAPHSLGADVASVSRRRRSTDLGDRLGLTDAEALRRVVVAREVLGPPLALRDDDGRSGGHRS